MKRIAAALFLSLMTPLAASAQNFPPQVPISQLPPGGPVQSSDLFPATRAGVTYGVTWPPSIVPFSLLPSTPANEIIGTIAIGPPSNLPIPGCNTSSAALTWTSGTGFGCHFIPTNSLSSILGATTTNTIDNAAWSQAWTWNSLTTGTALSLSTSTATSGTLFGSSITSSGNTGIAGYFSNPSTSGYAVYASGAANVTGNMTVGGNTLLSGTTTTANLTVTTAGALAGTTTIAGTLSVPANMTLSGTTTVSGAFNVSAISIPAAKVLAFQGAAASVTAGAGNCGTSPIISGDDTTGRITVGSSTNGGVCTLVFSSAKTTPPVCVCNDETAVSHGCSALGTSTTSTALTATTSFAAADSIGYHCFGYQQ